MAKLHINVDEKLKDKLKEVADKRQRSMNFIVVEALKKYLRIK